MPTFPRIGPAIGLLLALLPEAAQAAEKGKLPQLDATKYPSQLFWLGVLFVIVYVYMQFVGVPRLTAILDERRARIAADLDEAERLRRQSDEALQTYEATLADAHGRARALLAETHERNLAALAEQTRSATIEFDRQVADAIGTIDGARDTALAGLGDVARGLAADITAKIAGRAPAPDSVARAVDAAGTAEAA